MAPHEVLRHATHPARLTCHHEHRGCLCRDLFPHLPHGLVDLLRQRCRGIAAHEIMVPREEILHADERIELSLLFLLHCRVSGLWPPLATTVCVAELTATRPSPANVPAVHGRGSAVLSIVRDRPPIAAVVSPVT